MLKWTQKTFQASTFSEENIFPPLSQAKKPAGFRTTIDDYAGLFIDYGRRETSYPYSQQNAYTEETARQLPVVLLENDYLRAEFLPTLGGRLWRLYDKHSQRDLLYTNDVIRFRNLSIRNAWFSGGVEWNCALIGHSPFTCAPLYCAFVHGKGGEEVLRFYEFERVRGIFYQIDFWLEDCKLLVAVRIENPNEKVVPMYWWSNMAVPEYPHGRVIVPASSAYNNSDGIGVKKSSIPMDEHTDVSYPENILNTMDYFYDIPQNQDKFIASVDADGTGLLQFSTARLQGRKLFSWGHRPGSLHWQRMLTDHAGEYVEMQAGLGKTQYECIPMPPKTTWSFCECYTAANIPAAQAHGDYAQAVAAVHAQIETLGGCTGLENRMEAITKNISLQSGTCMQTGSGFGYLFGALGGKIPQQLSFVCAEDVDGWLTLQQGTLPRQLLSFAHGDAMEKLLLQHRQEPCWQICYQLALLAYDRRDFAQAKTFCAQSIVWQSTPQNNHLYAHILFQLDDAASVYFIEKCLRATPDNFALAESLFSLLLQQQAYTEFIAYYSLLTPALQENPRLLMYLSMATLQSGNAQEAEKILLRNGGLHLTDYREGDHFLDMLYRGIREHLYGENPDTVTVPAQFDFVVACESSQS
ncbi:MAG: DUF5107 domain-containing protein [Eubacteriales bacterium]|nr:DUF5107 domain-containing protein [Eubacteriales bacterium]